MGAVRLLRTLAPLALIGALATACGSGSSSSASTTPGDGSTPPSTTSGASSSSDQLQVRPVAARHSPGVQFGPQIPKELEAQLAKQPCPMKPVTFQAMMMEC